MECDQVPRLHLEEHTVITAYETSGWEFQVVCGMLQKIRKSGSICKASECLAKKFGLYPLGSLCG